MPAIDGAAADAAVQVQWRLSVNTLMKRERKFWHRAPWFDLSQRNITATDVEKQPTVARCQNDCTD